MTLIAANNCNFCGIQMFQLDNETALCMNVNCSQSQYHDNHQDCSHITAQLYYNGRTYRYTHNTLNDDRVYQSLDDLTSHSILTAPCDYDGVLQALLPEELRESEYDDKIRLFDSMTGKLIV